MATERSPLVAASPPLNPPSLTAPHPSSLPTRQTPLTIAHRGYKALYPENTLAAFAAAIAVGADALETDLHISKDGVVVLSHDPTLKRCFGRKERIVDCEWKFLEGLRTVVGGERMPRLLDLLLWLSEETEDDAEGASAEEGGKGRDKIWVLLDIKVPWPRKMEPVHMMRANERRKLDNEAEVLMRRVGETIGEAEEIIKGRGDGRIHRPWRERIVLGCWAASYLPLCAQYLPGYPISHIGFSIPYARQFLKVPGVSFNMLQSILVGPLGASFIRDVRAANRELFVWTVNKEEWMKWAIHEGVDGVITDDPKRFREVRGEWGEGKLGRVSWREGGALVWWNVVVFFFSLLFRCRYGFRIDQRKIKVEIRKRKSEAEVEDVIVAA